MGSTSTETPATATPLRDVFFPTVEYEPVLSHTESLGGKARMVWEETFADAKELAADSEVLYTGIGAAPGGNSQVPVRSFGDGSQVPLYIDLREQFGRVPRMLFLPASTFHTEQVLGLRSIARNYKAQGVEKIIVVLTSLAHERQDHQFSSSDGQPIQQATTLKDVIEDLALKRYIDGGLLIQPHSLRPIELALREGFPLLPLDAFQLLVKGTQLHEIENPFVMGPDKGRKDEARILASQLNCPMGSAKKSRDRLGNGDPVMIIPPEVLTYIREHRCNVIVADDEIREAGTTGGLAAALNGYAASLTILAVKGIFARPSGDLNGNVSATHTAVDRLMHPLISRIVITDAVRPMMDISPLRGKIVGVALSPEIESIAAYLKRSFTDPGNPDWLRAATETRTLLRLDLSIEQIEQG